MLNGTPRMWKMSSNQKKTGADHKLCGTDKLSGIH